MADDANADELAARRARIRVTGMADGTQAACSHARLQISLSHRVVACLDCCKQLDPFDVIVQVVRNGAMEVP